MGYIAHGLARDNILSVSSEELSRVELLLHRIKRFIQRHAAAVKRKNLRHLHLCFDKRDIGNLQGHVFVGTGNEQAAQLKAVDIAEFVEELASFLVFGAVPPSATIHYVLTTPRQWKT